MKEKFKNSVETLIGETIRRQFHKKKTINKTTKVSRTPEILLKIDIVKESCGL